MTSATSRNSLEQRVHRCEQRVHTPSRQHNAYDGILCAPAEGRTWAELAEALTGACRRECGFEVTVEAKVVEDTGRAAELREWVRMVEAAEGEAMQVD